MAYEEVCLLWSLTHVYYYFPQITNERNIKESDILNSRFQKLQQDLQEQMVLSDSIHQENQQKALELKVSIYYYAVLCRLERSVLIHIPYEYKNTKYEEIRLSHPIISSFCSKKRMRWQLSKQKQANWIECVKQSRGNCGQSRTTSLRLSSRRKRWREILQLWSEVRSSIIRWGYII